MFSEAPRLSRIQPSPSTLAAAKARDLKQSGVEVLDLTVGEPALDTPQHIKDAAIAAIERGETKYTAVNGTPALREAIRRRLERHLGVIYSDAELSVGSGAKHVIFTALMATLAAGDEVVIPAPYWVSYPDMVVVNDGVPVIVPCPAEEGFKLAPARLRESLTDRTRWLVLNAPANPTGAVYTTDELAALAAVLEEFPDVWVLTDEIYDEVYLGEDRSPSIVEVAPTLRDRVLYVNGVSKTYAMTGWRLGYCAGPAPLITAINKLQSHMTSCPSSISQAAAVEALTGDQSFVRDAARQYRARRDELVEGLDSIDGLRPVPGDGAFYVFVDCGGLLGRTTPSGEVLGTDDDVVGYLLDTARVATITGSAYGLSPFFRVSFATSSDTLSRAVEAISHAVSQLKK